MTPPEGTWQWFKASKYPAICAYCENDIPLNAGRWTMKADGKRWNACGDCLKPPENAPDRGSPPPLPGSPPAPPPSTDRDAEISAAHRENMESAQQMREVLAVIIVELHQLNETLRGMHMLNAKIYADGRTEAKG
jgi:hypothetical protein